MTSYGLLKKGIFKIEKFILMNNLKIDYNEKYLNIVKEKLLELSKGTSAEIFLFGSRAAGTAKQGSDIDVGFDNLSSEEFRKISIKFNIFWEDSIVPNKVDLVYFPEVSKGFRKQALKDKITWKEGLNIN